MFGGLYYLEIVSYCQATNRNFLERNGNMKKKLLSFATSLVLMATSLLPSFVEYAQEVDIDTTDSDIAYVCEEAECHDHHEHEECETHEEICSIECSFDSVSAPSEAVVYSNASASVGKVVPTVIAATHTHSYTILVGTKRAATCTKDGLGIYKCSGCSSTTEGAIKALGHSTQKKTVNPSCTSQGYTYSYCTREGCTYESTKSGYVPALGHDYSIVAGVKRAATCTEKGLNIVACSRCSSTTEKNTNALGHDMKSKTVNPSCTTQGYTYSYCARSGCSHETPKSGYVSALGHDYSIVAGVKRAATCTEKGLNIVACSRCSSTTEENTSELGHLMQTKTVNPSCTTQGYTYSFCSRSGCSHETAKTGYISALGHTYTDQVGTKREATCTEKGLGIFKCIRCTSTTEANTPALGHIEVTTKTQPTCEDAGYETTICERAGCNYRNTVKTANPLGHEIYTLPHKEATCTEPGYTLNFCTRDGCTHKYETDQEPFLGHDYSKVVVEPTCTEKGYTTSGCSREGCPNHSKTNYTDALGHNLTKKVVDPTCSVRGYTAYTCSRDGCDHSETTDYTDALGHDIDEKVVEPSCTTDGYTKHTCKRDGCTYSTKKDTVPATGHKYTQQVGTKREATCTSSGIGIFKCKYCSSITDGMIDAYGHQIKEEVFEPTYSEEGYTLKTCTRTGCNYSLKTNYKPVLVADTATIILSPNNGTQPWRITKNHGMPYGTLPTVTKTGYSFAGWYTQTLGGERITKDSIIPESGTIYLYAHWTPNTCLISYNSNGGETAFYETISKYGRTITIIPTTPTREGFTFLGWSTSPTATKPSYYPKGSYYVTGNTTFYAVWEGTDNVITYDTMGGSPLSSTIIPYGQETYGYLPTPIHSSKCYSFNGWYTDSSYTQLVKHDTIFPGNNVILYAKWSITHNASPAGGYVKDGNELKMPTCTEGGQYARVICSKCSMPLSTPYYVKPLGHSYTYTYDKRDETLTAECNRCDIVIDDIDYLKYLELRGLKDATQQVKAAALKDYLIYLGYDPQDADELYTEYVNVLANNKLEHIEELDEFCENSSEVMNFLKENQGTFNTLGKIDGFAEFISEDGPFGKLSAASDGLDLIIAVDNVVNGDTIEQVQGSLDLFEMALGLTPITNIIGTVIDEMEDTMIWIVNGAQNKQYQVAITHIEGFPGEFTFDNLIIDGKITNDVHIYDITIEDLAAGNNFNEIMNQCVADNNEDEFVIFVLARTEYEAHCLETGDTTSFGSYFITTYYNSLNN